MTTLFRMRISVLGLIAVFFILGEAAAMTPKLEDIHEDIQSDYREVSHLTSEELQQLDPSTTVLFDVRKQREYEVSHIFGAIQIDPDISAEAFAS